MAYIKDGKVYRNIQEQVQKNKEDILDLKRVGVQLADLGIKVIGTVDTEDDLPEELDNYGDAYLVGEEAPYDLYIWSRPDSEHEYDHYINIGKLNVVGPKGDKGDKGDQGEQGIQGPAGPQGPTGATGLPGTSVTANPGGTPQNVLGTIRIAGVDYLVPITTKGLLKAMLKGSDYISVDDDPNDPNALIIEFDQTDFNFATVLADLARALKTPLVTPQDHVLVGIDDTNGQELIGIGKGLGLNNGELETKLYIHTLHVLGDLSNEMNVEFWFSIITTKSNSFSEQELTTFLLNYKPVIPVYEYNNDWSGILSIQDEDIKFLSYYIVDDGLLDFEIRVIDSETIQEV